ncbi:MAG TPA: hypothetical protein DEB63_21495 [Agrobacterium sp.]|uniref:hypothetical protein n=1 Tax=Rhizobium TaxID=379 RepID=UPI000E9EE017|nr:hypothetical protein [Agrobacterium sp.]
MNIGKLRSSILKRWRKIFNARPNGVLSEVDVKEVAEWIRQANENAFINKELSAIYYEDMLCEAMLRRYGEKFVAKHNAHVFSQTYEDSAIAEIFARIGVKHKTFIELGTENGNQNTTRFLLEMGWKGVWIEGSPDHVHEIREKFANEIRGGKLIVEQAFITAENISGILEATDIGAEVDFMSVDIDQNTSHVWKAIPIKARAACIEYNAHIHPSIEYEVPYNPKSLWDGSNLFGGSLKAMELIGRSKAMSLVGCDIIGVNAYFVSDDCLENKFLSPYTSEFHYQPPRYRFARGDRGNPHASR